MCQAISSVLSHAILAQPGFPLLFPSGALDTLHSPQMPVRQPNPDPLPTAPSLLTSCAWPRQPRPRGAARREGGRGSEALLEEGEEE